MTYYHTKLLDHHMCTKFVMKGLFSMSKRRRIRKTSITWKWLSHTKFNSLQSQMNVVEKVQMYSNVYTQPLKHFPYKYWVSYLTSDSTSPFGKHTTNINSTSTTIEYTNIWKILLIPLIFLFTKWVDKSFTQTFVKSPALKP